MYRNKNIKPKIIEKLNNLIDNKIELLKDSIETAKESRDNETKSSVGDKYETARAMVQVEIEKSQAQLAKAENLKNTLTKINIQKEFKKVEYGSFVETNQGNFFISIPFGEIQLNEIQTFCVSLMSPLGKILEGKTKGDKIQFQRREIEIIDIF